MSDQGTEYIVLKFPAANSGPNAISSVPGFRDVGRVTAANADSAIREVAEKEGAGRYVAVPTRSWVPRIVEIETTTSVKFAKEKA